MYKCAEKVSGEESKKISIILRKVFEFLLYILHMLTIGISSSNFYNIS